MQQKRAFGTKSCICGKVVLAFYQFFKKDITFGRKNWQIIGLFLLGLFLTTHNNELSRFSPLFSILLLDEWWRMRVLWLEDKQSTKVRIRSKIWMGSTKLIVEKLLRVKPFQTTVTWLSQIHVFYLVQLSHSPWIVIYLLLSRIYNTQKRGTSYDTGKII